MWDMLAGWLGRPSAPVEEPEHLGARIRRLELRAVRLVASVFGGNYRSVFRGRGLEFDEVREYQEGDEPRLIDWNVTARMDRPYVKTFVEERELTVMLVVDVSASGDFGSGERLKRELAAELVGALALGALRSQDRVGLVLFADRIRAFVPPRKGRGHVHRLLRTVLEAPFDGRSTDWAELERQLMLTLKGRCVLFVVSDYLGGSHARALKVLGARHDVVPVVLSDPREAALPDLGLVRLEDPETGATAVIDTADPAVREGYAQAASEHRAMLLASFRALGLDPLALSTEEGPARPLLRFFEQRRRRRLRRRAAIAP